MSLSEVSDIAILIVFGLLLLMMLVPPLVLFYLWRIDRGQDQHAVLRNFPLLGRLRYLFEHVGPEFRQYLFDHDTEGKPFARTEYLTVVFAGKYLKTLISFGSKRDFEEPGWYIRNTILPKLGGEMAVVREPRLATKKYKITDDGLFTRKEKMVDDQISPWTLAEEVRPTIGGDLAHPWRPAGLIGMSGMSYGSLGRHAIRAMSAGLAGATGTFMNTGEGGLSDHHLSGGGDIVFQIGPGLFGVRTEDGAWDWDEFKRKAAIAQVVAFELKFHQGAKIRGGHVEGSKVTEEIAKIRRVKPWTTIDSPNRFPMFDSIDDVLDHVGRMRREGGKPVGIKIVVGGPGSVDDLAERIAARDDVDRPDWLAVDGGEGGSGATYQEMADSMGLPVRSGIIELDDALRRAGVRDRVKVFASGRLFTADRIAIALAFGADMCCIGRGLMISVGCIQAMQCHNNTCPVGVATTDEHLMKALVVEEKKWRVMNYMVTMRAGLTSLSAACGLASPTELRREHAVYRDRFGRISGAETLFPYPEKAAAGTA